MLAMTGVMGWNAAAQNVTFLPTTGNWNMPGNWSGGIVPNASQNPIIYNGKTATVDANVGTCASLFVGQSTAANRKGTVLFRNGAVLTAGNLLLGRDENNYGQFNQMGGTLTVNGYVSVGDGAGGGTGASGEYDLSAGTLQLTGGGSYVQVGNQGVGRMLVAGAGVLSTPALAIGNTAGSSGSQFFQWGGTVNVTNLTVGSTAGASNCSFTISSGAVQWTGLLLVQDLLTVQGTKCLLQGTATSGGGLQLTGAGTLQVQLDGLGITPIQITGSQLSMASGSKLIVDGSQYSRWNGSPGSFPLIQHGGCAGQTNFTPANVAFTGFGGLTPALVYTTNAVTLVLTANGLPQMGQGLFCEYWELPINQDGMNNGHYIAAPLTALPGFTNSLVVTHPVFGRTVSNVNLTASLRSTNYLMRFSGYVNVPTNGSYTFYLNSDDGSRLWLDDAPVVNNDGAHEATEVSGTTNLTVGLHKLMAGYFQNTGGAVLELRWAGPGLAKQLVPDNALFLTEQPNAWVRQPTYRNITYDQDLTYNYAPSFMYDETEGLYKIWFCGSGSFTILGDNVIYKEATSLTGLLSAPLQVALAPSGNATKFDQVHACDPNVYRVGNLYYLTYSGNTDGSQLAIATRIGMALSYDRGRTFQRLNGGVHIIAPTNTSDPNAYGTGQSAVVPANDGFYYMIYTDAQPGAVQYERVVRSLDPAFPPGSFTNVASLTQIPGSSLDLSYDTNTSQFIVINQLTMIYFDANWNLLRTMNRVNPFAWTFGEGHGLLMDSRKNPINYNQDGVPSYVFAAATVEDTNNTTLWANWVEGDLKYLVLPQTTLPPGSNVVSNGNFTASASSFTNWPGVINQPGNQAAIAGWSTVNGGGVGVNGTGTTVGDPYGPANTSGYTYAFIQGGMNGLTQNLTLQPNSVYQLDYDVAARAGETNDTYRVQTGDVTQTYYSVSNVLANPTAFNHVTALVTTPATFNGTPSIQLINLTIGDNTIEFANVSLILRWTKPTTTTGLSSSPNPSTTGGAVRLTATVMTTNGIPTGTVTFMDGATTLGTNALGGGSGNTATATLTLTNLASGAHSLTAGYGGDANWGGSTSSALVQVVSTLPNLITNGDFTSNAVAFTNAPGYTQPWSAGNPANITGWNNLNGLQLGVNGTATTAGDLFGPASTGGRTYAFIQGGVNGLRQNLTLSPYTIYQLDFDVAARTGNTASYRVQMGDNTQTYYSVSNALGNNSAFNHVTATFATPTTLSGTPSIQLINLTAGDNTIDFANVSLFMVGGKGPASANLAAPSPNPSTYGSTVTLTATVRTTGGIPTGTVTFMDGGVALGTGMLGGGSGVTATAALTVTNLSAATHSLSASYGGDANYAGALSSARSLVVNPKQLTVTGVTAENKIYNGGTDATLSGTVALVGVVSGDTVTLTGTPVSSFADKNVGTGKPVSTSGYTLGGANATNYSLTQPALSANIMVRPVTLSGSRVYDGTTAAAAAILTIGNNVDGANLTLTGSGTLASRNVGSQAIAAGTLVLGGSAAGNYTLTGLSGSVTITASASTTALVSALNPSPTGSNVVFTATVSAPGGGGTPTNAVQFRTNGVAAALVNLNSSAQAAYATSLLPHGSNVVTVEYVSDGNFLASTGSMVQVVNAAPVANALTLGAVSGLAATLQVIGGTNATDADGDPLRVTAVGAPVHGIAITDGTNAAYTATNNFAGTDSFNYTVSDNYGGTASNTVTVNVIANSAGLNRLTAGLSVGNVVLTYLGIPWNNYALEQTFSLSPPAWLPVVTNSASANGYLQFTNPPPPGTSSFWRTRSVP